MIVNQENNSDESEVSDSYTNSRTSFRVSICLRRYFKDHRARCYMQVTRNRRVRWLEKRIQKVFALSHDFCLCSNGHLLPSTEPLALLDPGDPIEVIPLRNTQLHDLNVNSGLLNGSNVISETTPPIINENSSSFGYEISQNNSFITNNVEIIENSENVLEKNLNSVKSVELISHNTINNQSKLSSIHRDEKDIYKQSTYDKVDGSMENLEQMKKHALKLFESECGAATSAPPRRVRRRVRRRARPSASPAPIPIAPLLPPPFTSEPHTPHLRFSSPPPSPQKSSPVTAGTSSPQEVTQNEEANARLPRVIRPIGLDD